MCSIHIWKDAKHSSLEKCELKSWDFTSCPLNGHYNEKYDSKCGQRCWETGIFICLWGWKI